LLNPRGDAKWLFIDGLAFCLPVDQKPERMEVFETSPVGSKLTTSHISFSSGGIAQLVERIR